MKFSMQFSDFHFFSFLLFPCFHSDSLPGVSVIVVAVRVVMSNFRFHGELFLYPLSLNSPPGRDNGKISAQVPTS